MEEFISRRTVLVVVISSKVRMTLNALSDDVSTKRYIIGDVTEQLKLKRIPKPVTVNVLNNQVKTFETLPVEFNLESLNRKLKQKLYAYTTDRVAGKMRPINLKKCKDKWKHYKNINFPARDRRPLVDVLICKLVN